MNRISRCRLFLAIVNFGCNNKYIVLLWAIYIFTFASYHDFRRLGVLLGNMRLYGVKVLM